MMTIMKKKKIVIFMADYNCCGFTTVVYLYALDHMMNNMNKIAINYKYVSRGEYLCFVM